MASSTGFSVTARSCPAQRPHPPCVLASGWTAQAPRPPSDLPSGRRGKGRSKGTTLTTRGLGSTSTVGCASGASCVARDATRRAVRFPTPLRSDGRGKGAGVHPTIECKQPGMHACLYCRVSASSKERDHHMVRLALFGRTRSESCSFYHSAETPPDPRRHRAPKIQKRKRQTQLPAQLTLLAPAERQTVNCEGATRIERGNTTIRDFSSGGYLSTYFSLLTYAVVSVKYPPGPPSANGRRPSPN